MALLTNKTALPVTLPDSTGRVHTLREYHGAWLLMVFHRHLG